MKPTLLLPALALAFSLDTSGQIPPPPMGKAEAGPVRVKACEEDKKMQQVRALVDKIIVRGAEGFETWLDSSVTIAERNRMRDELAQATRVVQALAKEHQLSVVIVYDEVDRSIFRCRFIGDVKERFRMDVHYRTTACTPRIIGLRIDREPPPDQRGSDEPPPPPPAPSFIIER